VGLKWELTEKFGFNKVSDFVDVRLELWAGVDGMSGCTKG
jgi:hypothetical protein